eukprot:760227-Hanusia_phi.AAC.2
MRLSICSFLSVEPEVCDHNRSTEQRSLQDETDIESKKLPTHLDDKVNQSFLPENADHDEQDKNEIGQAILRCVCLLHASALTTRQGEMLSGPLAPRSPGMAWSN